MNTSRLFMLTCLTGSKASSLNPTIDNQLTNILMCVRKVNHSIFSSPNPSLPPCYFILSSSISFASRIKRVLFVLLGLSLSLSLPLSLPLSPQSLKHYSYFRSSANSNLVPVILIEGMQVPIETERQIYH
jgi:hypothetical protein